MKKHFERPSFESCEFVVAARLQNSGGPLLGGIAHDAGNGGAPCTLTASNGAKACAATSTKNSAQHKACS